MLYEAEFWVLVAFLIFAGVLVYVGVPQKILGALDAHSRRVAEELAEARRLREQAEGLFGEYKAKRETAEREAEAIVANARDEAERLAREAEEKLADFVRRRTAAAEAKIAQAETQATAEVRAAAVEAAIQASERVLRAEVAGPTADELLDRGLAQVRAKLNS